MKRSRWLGLVAGAMLLVSGPAGDAAQPAATASPKLLVIVVVDQMRFDYLDRYARFWEHGLKRLRDEGAVFEQAFYPYLNTVTCAGHATIGTGTFPATHGIIMNEWWQRDEQRRVPCTDDRRVVSLRYGGTADRIGHSARQTARADARRSAARRLAGVARRHAVDETAKHGHARRAWRHGGDLVRRRERLGHVVGLRARPGSRGRGVREQSPGRSRSRGGLEPDARGRRVHRRG